MKNEKKLRVAAAVCAILVSSAVTVYAAYDSSKDPVVSLSYLTEVFKPSVKSELKSELSGEVKSQIVASVGELSDEISQMKGSLSEELYSKLSDDYAATIAALQRQVDSLTNVYAEVNMKKNARLTADAASEIVVLSGSVTVRCSDPDSGIIDCTDGVILYDGQSVPLNHKLLVPQNGDGRGCSAATDATLLVRGGYTLGK